jgi:CheY-like chemotaxis protein
VAKVDDILEARFFVKVKMPKDLVETTPRSTAASIKTESITLHGRILLAEDGRDNQRLLTLQLRDRGAEVVIAENGQIAVDLAANDSFDLILMDIQMPVMDGYTAATTLRRLGCATAIVALTASSSAEDRKKCVASGCTDYLRKPVDCHILLKAVSQYLGKAAIATSPASNLSSNPA